MSQSTLSAAPEMYAASSHEPPLQALARAIDKEQFPNKEAEGRYQRMLNSVLDIVFETDNEGRWTFLNSAWTNITGHTLEESMGLSFLDFVHEEDRAGNIEKFGPLIRREKELCRHVVRYLTKSGGFRWIEVHARLKLDANDQTIGTCGILRDITAQKEAELALKKAEERYVLAARGTNDGLWDWDIVNQEIYYSPRWKAMLGYEDNELPSTAEAWFTHVHTSDLPRIEAALQAHYTGRTEQFECEHRMQRRDGTWRWMLSRGTALRDAAGNPIRIAGSLTDVTESKVRDPITGLSNRVHFLHRLELAIEHSRRDVGFRYAVLYVDLDGFKVVNDSLGHTAGNAVLAEVAHRLENVQKPCPVGTLVARLGGDEFGVLMEGSFSATCPIRLAAAMENVLLAPVEVLGREVRITLSTGIALNLPSFRTPEDVLCAADTAMYEAKRGGRNQAKVFRKEMQDRVRRRLDRESEVRRAVELKQIEVHYQPQIRLSGCTLAGVEALARWRHPERGLLPPSQFISIAEDTGLILPLGYMVLTEACRQAGDWRRRRPADMDWAMSVNLSPKQLMDPDLVDHVKTALDQNGLPPSHLNLELTESCLVENHSSLIRVMERLRGLGVGLHMDDFGTGYSSLSYLQRFPFTALKLDRSFVTKVDSPNSREIVATIVKLAQILKLEAVAEGIETAAQATVLSDLQCDYGQGYYFSKPLDRLGVENLVALGSVRQYRQTSSMIH